MGFLKCIFEHSLGWGPWIDNLQRRLPLRRPIESQFASSGLTSWSRLGWEDSVTLRCQSAIEVTRSYIIQEAFPITEWYTGDLPWTPPEQRRRIQWTWHEKRKGYKDFIKPMPSGWKR